jgi:hypothetical protein
LPRTLQSVGSVGENAAIGAGVHLQSANPLLRLGSTSSHGRQAQWAGSLPPSFTACGQFAASAPVELSQCFRMVSGVQLCATSAPIKSSCEFPVAIVMKHCVQMESMVESLFFRWKNLLIFIMGSLRSMSKHKTCDSDSSKAIPHPHKESNFVARAVGFAGNSSPYILH